MKIKELYYYTFYKFYRLINSSSVTRGNAKFKAILLLIVIESWVAFSFINYYDLLVLQKQRHISSALIVSLIGFTWFIKWLFFIRNDNWIKYVERFDQWPPQKNRKGTLIVMLVITLLTLNFIIPFYLNPPPGRSVALRPLLDYRAHAISASALAHVSLPASARLLSCVVYQ